MFLTEFVQKIKTNVLCSVTLSQKSCSLWDNVERHSTARQAADGNTIRRVRTACWISKATNTYSEYVIRMDWDVPHSQSARCKEENLFCMTKTDDNGWRSGAQTVRLQVKPSIRVTYPDLQCTGRPTSPDGALQIGRHHRSARSNVVVRSTSISSTVSCRYRCRWVVRFTIRPL